MRESTYEVVPYDDRPVAETHPDRVWLAARRAGLELAPPERMRVLELGCAHGINLVPMAFHLPPARFLGIDLSPRQIERGRAWVEALGLGNLELRCADVMDFEPEAGAFDLVIAHGLFSWVPLPVRDRVLETCRRALAPSGVAYLSYNAMPAWGIRGGIRRALLEMVGEVDDDREKLRRARAGLEHLARIDPLRGSAEGALVAQEIEGLRGKGDAYLLHEYLVPWSRAYWIREFVALAEGAGLHFLGDVAPTGLEHEQEARVRAEVGELVAETTAREQLFDVVAFRQFRASLVCRDDAPRGSAPSSAEWVSMLRLVAPPGEADEITDPALAWLRARWPADAGLEELTAATGSDLAAVVDQVQRGRVQLRPRALPISPTAKVERPAVSELARFEARHLDFVSTPLHEYAPLDAFHAALIEHLDGSRTRPDLVLALADDVLAGRLQVARGPTPARDQLRAGLPPLIDAALDRLRAAGLLLPA